MSGQTLEATEVKLLPLDSVLDQTGLGRGTMWKLIARGDFPKPVRISDRRVAWSSKSINDWINARIARPYTPKDNWQAKANCRSKS